jgi:hypothetical protein
MIWQYPNMEHVGIGKYHPGSLPYLSPLRLRGIAIKGGNLPYME